MMGARGELWIGGVIGHVVTLWAGYLLGGTPQLGGTLIVTCFWAGVGIVALMAHVKSAAQTP